jgi:hypothetical protein
MRKLTFLLLVTSAIFPLFSEAHSLNTLGSADSLVYSVSNFSDPARRDTLQSVDVDVTAFPGSIVLARGDQKNFAPAAKFTIVYYGPFPQKANPQVPNTFIPDTAKMNPAKLQDGDVYSFVEIPPGNVGTYIMIDLRAIRRVNRLQVSTLGELGVSRNLRPQAFSYYAGVDSLIMTKVYQEIDNQDSVHTAFLSEPVVARYIRFVLDKQAQTTSTVIAEMRIFGNGYLSDGQFVSRVDSSGAGAANFGRVYVDADFDVATTVTFQMRTGNTYTVDNIWSPWSDPKAFSNSADAATGTFANVYEPRKFFQYSLKLYTGDLGTPKVKNLKIIYQTTPVADSTLNFISPNDVAVLSPVTLVDSIMAYFSSSSLGIDTIIIHTQSPCVVRTVTIGGQPVEYTFISSPEKMTIGFPQTLKPASAIAVSFSTKLIQAASFPAEILSKISPWNPQFVDPKRSGAGAGWTVTTSGIPLTPIVDFHVDPNPFTPNGDGKNDVTIIDFSIANVEVPKALSISVFDLAGKKVRTIVSLMTATHPFFGNPLFGGRGILWDGKNDAGKLVLPGVYIIQVSYDVDNGGSFVNKPVVVAY